VASPNTGRKTVLIRGGRNTLASTEGQRYIRGVSEKLKNEKKKEEKRAIKPPAKKGKRKPPSLGREHGARGNKMSGKGVKIL